MNKTIIVALLALATLTNCGTQTFDEESITNNESTTEENIKHVTFSIDGTQSNTESVTGETRALSTTLANRCEKMKYWIFDNDYKNVVDSGTQKKTDADYGKFSADLVYGTYHVVAVGHKQKSDVVLNRSNMMIQLGDLDDHNYDTYYGNIECKVAKEITGTSLTLKKNMCYVIVRSNEKTDNIDTLKVSLSAYGTSFSAKTGFAESTTKSQIKFNYIFDGNSYPYMDFNILFPLPSDDTEYKSIAIFTPIDKNNEKLPSTTISDIPVKIGRKITYIGKLWENESSSFTIDVSDEDWVEGGSKEY